MAAVVKFFKTIRNNWKKTVFFSVAAAYGANYGKGKYEESLLRRAFCQEAQKFGAEPLPLGARPRKITVFLNPAAKNGKCRKLFEKHVAPILYLAGMEVTVVKTEYEGQAKKYMEVIDDVDGVVVAGGDGTLSEVVTGLLRRPDHEKMSRIPIGFIPLGLTNALANTLYGSDKKEISRLMEAAWAIVDGTTTQVDAMAITGNEDKTIYAVNSLEWGPFKETENKKSRFKLFGSLKHKIPWITSTVSRDWPRSVQAKVSYCYRCEGCSRCYSPPPIPVWRWWHIFLPPRIEVPKIDYSEVENEECGRVYERDVDTMEFTVSTRNSPSSDNDNHNALRFTIGPGPLKRSEFIREGLRRQNEGRNPELYEDIDVQSITINPTENKSKSLWYIIDQEEFEIMPVAINLQKNKLKMFVPDPTKKFPSPTPS